MKRSFSLFLFVSLSVAGCTSSSLALRPAPGTSSHAGVSSYSGVHYRLYAPSLENAKGRDGVAMISIDVVSLRSTSTMRIARALRRGCVRRSAVDMGNLFHVKETDSVGFVYKERFLGVPSEGVTIVKPVDRKRRTCLVIRGIWPETLTTVMLPRYIDIVRSVGLH